MANNIRINSRVASALQVGDVIAQSAYYGQSFVFITAFDPDAATYIEAVEAADEQTLEAGVKLAIDVFVTGCKADGIWDAIKVSCILAGARTLNGALVPLAGDAPTNFNFVSDDYDRVTGLKGDGGTKYLDSNQSKTGFPTSDNHMSLFISEMSDTNSQVFMGAEVSDGRMTIGYNGNFFVRNRHNTAESIPFQTGFMALARNNLTGYIGRSGGTDNHITRDATDSDDSKIWVFRRRGGTNLPATARMSFYSLGKYLEPANFDARVSTLMAEIEAALT